MKVNPTRQKFLAGATLTLEEDRDVGAAYFFKLMTDGPHSARAAEENLVWRQGALFRTRS